MGISKMLIPVCYLCVYSVCLQFPVPCFCHSNSQLVGAGGRFEAAGVAGKRIVDLVSGPAVHNFGDGLQVAVAAACEDNVFHCVAVHIKLNFNRADTFWIVFVFHFAKTLIAAGNGLFLNVVMIPHSAVFFIYNNECKLL